MTTNTPQVAINDIGSEADLIAAIDETIKYFNDGDIVEGTVVKVDHDEVLLDIGYKTEGVILSRELSIKHDVNPDDVVAVGDQIEALVLQKEDKEGRLLLSKKRAQYERAWGQIEKVKEEDGVVTGTVIEVVKGGLILDIGLRGFLPASLVEMRRVRDLAPYIGREIEAKIIELDKNRNNVVLSRRAWLEQTQSEVRTNFLHTLQKGQVRSGVVSSIVNFGAFVDLGGVDGLVHVSELSWKHIDHPSEVVEVGQEVTVEVLDVDMDRERVSLSLKATQEDPWQAFARTHAIGQVVPGKVTKLVPFGAFVRVEDGIEGLVHISELAQRHVELPDQVVKVGEEVFVKVIDIDLERRRISLSLKQANEGVDPTSEEFDPSLYGMAAEYDENGNYKFEGRFNQGVVSINLPQIGLEVRGDMDKFWPEFDRRLEICYEALMCRHNALKGVRSDVSPIHWQYGALARLDKGETIDKLLYGGYSSISLGYIGLYELTYLMTGKSHTTEEGQTFALAVMNHLNETVQRWKAETNIGFALYGTPAESLCYRFAEIDRERYGTVENVTDKGYYTNSYHVDVREDIDAFSKFQFESQFQSISKGGCISYVEVPNMSNNLTALEDVIHFIYNNIQYAEFNTKSDYCQVCGYEGEIRINDNLEWECPVCGNRDQRKMNVVRRTCGYLGENYWNVGKTKEIRSRVMHL